MLKVSPIQTKEEQEQICAQCGIEFRPECLAYKAYDEGLIGICQFSISDDKGIIQNLSYAPGVDDKEAMIIMLRATMSFMNRCGIANSFFKKENVDSSLYEMSSYKRIDDNTYYIDLDKFYNSRH